jgi:hypothetical protein
MIEPRWFMSTSKIIFAAGIVASFLFMLHGCTRSTSTATTSAADSSPHKGRTQLWQENCNRCHNARSSRYYGDEQWDVAMHHMRIRGSLTAHETRQILEFLQSAN